MAAAKAAGKKKKPTAKAPAKPAAKGVKALAKTVVAKAKAALAPTKGAKSVAAKAAPAKASKTPPPPSPKASAKGAAAAAAKIAAAANPAAKSLTARRTVSPVYSGRGQSAAGDSVCREVACEGLATASNYCRLHYIKNWKKIKRKELILKERKLNQYIEELVAKYPDKYIEAIRQDLANDKEFALVIKDLDLDESIEEFTEGEGEPDDGVIEGIRRDFDDTDDGF